MTTTETAATAAPPIDSRPVFFRALDVAAATIAAVPAERLHAATPCDEFDVQGLLAHLVGVVDRAAAIGRGEDGMSTPGIVEPVADEAWADAFSAAATHARAAWADDAALARTIVLPWVTGPGGEVLLGYVNELVVHTWDVAQGAGVRPVWDDEVVAGAYHAITATLPPEGRTEMFDSIREAMRASMGTGDGADAAGDVAFAPPFAERVAVPSDASALDRLLAYNGRSPAAA